ncbi:MAG: SurA N-terminal domain-containing protein, partial [Sedimentitalea sp.]
MAIGVKSISQTFVWILLGLLIVGLAGFGATNMSGTVTTVGQAGDQQITVDEYARELQREIRAIEARTRQPLQMTQVAQLGLDQAVLARLVALASLDHEVSELGLSVGDEVLQSEIVQIDAFQGISGGFDRDTYRFALSQAGIRERDFEDDLRAEAARTLVQGAIVSGVQMPQTLANTMLDYVGARRTFTWAKLEADTLDAPIPEPSEGDLRGFYDENPDLFQLPETKRLTYVLLTPDMILDQVELDDAAVRTLYDDRKAEYDLPERRLVERLVFADQTAAEQARAQLDVGGTTFP